MSASVARARFERRRIGRHHQPVLAVRVRLRLRGGRRRRRGRRHEPGAAQPGDNLGVGHEPAPHAAGAQVLRRQQRDAEVDADHVRVRSSPRSDGTHRRSRSDRRGVAEPAAHLAQRRQRDLRRRASASRPRRTAPPCRRPADRAAVRPRRDSPSRPSDAVMPQIDRCSPGTARASDRQYLLVGARRGHRVGEPVVRRIRIAPGAEVDPARASTGGGRAAATCVT